VAEFVTEFTAFAGQVLLGLVIFAIGLYLANLVARTVKASGVAQAGLLALAVRVSILALAGAMALRQIGLANEIINLAFGLLLGAVAVAAALAFGLGGRETASRELEAWSSRPSQRNRDAKDRASPLLNRQREASTLPRNRQHNDTQNLLYFGIFP
jgi:hypothetical protein